MRTLLFSIAVASCFILTTCSPKEECQSGTTSCGAFTACCTSDNCYYKWNNKKFNCNGTDCTQAANDLAKAMCGVANASAISETAKAALAKTKASLESGKCSTCP